MKWDLDWAWSLPVIILTVALHVVVLGFVAKQIVDAAKARSARNLSMMAFCYAVGMATLTATVLLGLHTAIWACLYLAVGALPDAASAMLYSLNALTSYGHAEVFLNKGWQLMGALEAVNGSLLFGLTTAFLFAAIQAVWPISRG